MVRVHTLPRIDEHFVCEVMVDVVILFPRCLLCLQINKKLEF